ncbi:sensor histidine kinase [Armatimonas rosea]|uniref:Signal transduction histidine kinase n=1 Tax=Armatimonas rosea TaxID=685828 RepID=A0A7W9SRE2_ARMRO|nr:sensor histidine kinase [Armatimonas rosea]MBB6051431.1 signal transduction histidine kinase [Armatimonas rosea]
MEPEQLSTNAIELTHVLMMAREEERRIVAYDLHDGLTQYIAATNAHLEACIAAWDSGQHERARAQLAKAHEYIGFAGLESRRMVNSLRCLSLEDLGLAGAVEQLLADEQKRTGWESATLSHNLSSERFEPRIETAAFRVVQEALNNARKHAQASHVQVMLLLAPDKAVLTLEVSDNGVGLEHPAPNDGKIPVGMHGMRERVRTLEGSFEVQSLPEGGVRVRASIPLKQKGDQQYERV